MIRHLESQDNFYLVKCADLDCIVLSDSVESAACLGLREILDSKGSKANLSFLISVDSMKKENVGLFKTSDVLSDIGYFKLAEELDSLRDFFLDKGKNSH